LIENNGAKQGGVAFRNGKILGVYLAHPTPLLFD